MKNQDFTPVSVDAILPNPQRNFDVYPLNEQQVHALMQSFKDNGDFGVLPARHNPDGPGFQIAAGHHRLEAMKRLGYTAVDLKIGDYDEYDMLSMMADENTTQGGASNAAVDDTVIAGAKLLSYWMILANDLSEFNEIYQRSEPLFTNPGGYTKARSELINNSTISAGSMEDFLRQTLPLKTIALSIDRLKAQGFWKPVIEQSRSRVADELKAVEEEELRIYEEARKAEEARLKAEAEEAEREAKRQERLKALEEEAKRLQEEKDAKAKEAAELRMKEEQTRLAQQAIEAEKRRKQVALERQNELARQEKLSAKRDQVVRASYVADRAANNADKNLKAWVNPEAAKLFDQPGHVAAFQDAIKPRKDDLFVPENQVQLVQYIIKTASSSNNGEVTIGHIKDTVNAKIAEVDKYLLERRQREEEEALKRNKQMQAERLMENFKHALRQLENSMDAFNQVADDPEVISHLARNRSDTLLVRAFDRLIHGLPILRDKLGVREDYARVLETRKASGSDFVDVN